MESESKDVVYELENRGSGIVFHWFLFMISGLLDIADQPKPIQIHGPTDLEFQKTTYELLGSDFVFVDDLTGKTVKKNYGAQCVPEAPCDLFEPKYYTFLRNQILKNYHEPCQLPFRKLYIRRNRAHMFSHHAGLKRRHVWEEDALCERLTAEGYECIYMEEYPLKEKIRLMQEAKIVVAPNSGGLTFCLFAHPETRVVEIHEESTRGEDQYYNICKGVGLHIERYTDVNAVTPIGAPSSTGLLIEYMLQIRDMDTFLAYLRTLSIPLINEKKMKSIQKTYIVHYKPLTSRRESLEPALKQYGFEPYEFWDQYDRNTLDPVIRNQYYKRSFLNDAQICITITHIEIYKAILRDPSIQYALILEDDAQVPNDFRMKFDIYMNCMPDDLEIGMIGEGCGLHANGIVPDKLWYPVESTRTCVGYVISRDCCERILPHLEPFVHAIDWQLNYIIKDHSVKCYWAEPTILGHGSAVYGSSYTPTTGIAH